MAEQEQLTEEEIARAKSRPQILHLQTSHAECAARLADAKANNKSKSFLKRLRSKLRELSKQLRAAVNRTPDADSKPHPDARRLLHGHPWFKVCAWRRDGGRGPVDVLRVSDDLGGDLKFSSVRTGRGSQAHGHFFL